MTAPGNLAPAPGGPASATFLHALVERLSDWVLVLDQDFRLQFCNAAFSREAVALLGLPVPGIGGDMRAWLAGLPEPQRAALEGAWNKALQGEEQLFSCLLGAASGPQQGYQVCCQSLDLDGRPGAMLTARRLERLSTELERAMQRNAELAAEVADLARCLAQAQSTSHERWARLSAALSVVEAGTFRHDLRRQLGYWDEALQRSFGVEHSERPRPLAEFLQIVHPRDRAGVKAHMEAAAHELGPRSGIFLVVHPDRSVRWLQYGGWVFAGDDGRPLHLIGACADITSQRQAERELREQERMLQELADHVPVIVWIQAQDLSLQYVNRRWRDYSGLDLTASRNGGWRRLLCRDDLPALRSAMARAIRTNSPFELECRIRRASDGAYRWHLVRSVPHLDSAGQPARWYGTAVDIEDKVRSQARLEQARTDLEQANRILAHGLARFESLVSSLSDGLVLFDAKGNRILVNPAARRLNGIPDNADLSGQSGEAVRFELRDLDGNLIPEENWPSRRALRGETFSGLELRMRRLNDGSEWTASFSGAPVVDELGNQEYAVLTFYDVSERRAAEEALQAAVQARDRFLSIASHELRTPLTTLIMQLQMARRRIDPETGVAPSAAELARTFDVANRQAMRLAKLVDDLLDVSRSGMDKLEFHFQPTDLGQLVKEVVGQFDIALERAGCPLSLDLVESVVGEWDTARLEQMVGNLLSNAIKYAAGTEIRITLRREQDWAVRQVRDHGPGIPSESRAKIFDRFERYVADTAITGLGLGLFLAREIVRGHGGTIELTEPAGSGACFIVTLPLRPPSSAG